MYKIRRPSTTKFIPIRHHRYHVRTWGQPRPGEVPLFMVHGWMDVSASYQFVVDAMESDRYIIAPDWRGFGQTRQIGCQDKQPGVYGAADHYVFPDYLADLDMLFDHVNAELGRGDEPMDLVGHSMGGNASMMYAGVRPHRIRKLVNLEGFGMPATSPSLAPSRYGRWIDQIKQLHLGEMHLKAYDSIDGVVQRLIKTNHRLPADKAAWLAREWAAADTQGRWQILGDSAHKIINPLRYRVDELLELFKCITAPVLAVEADTDSLKLWHKPEDYTMAQYHERLKNVADCRIAVVKDAGHMLHHDQPAAVARLIEDFLN